MTQTHTTDTQTIALLNDLLQLDHDALEAYTLAIQGVEDPLHRETLTAFRADHERHVHEIVRLIEAHGGSPVQIPHIPTGKFKLAVQAAGNAGGERAVLMAFKANERQVRDKYVRASGEALPPDIAEVVTRNAADEVKHYAWASEAMEVMGAGEGTLAGRAESAFETVHAKAADAIEGIERRAMEQAARVRDGFRSASRANGSPGRSAFESVQSFARRSPLAALALALATGVLLRRMLR